MFLQNSDAKLFLIEIPKSRIIHAIVLKFHRDRITSYRGHPILRSEELYMNNICPERKSSAQCVSHGQVSVAPRKAHPRTRRNPYIRISRAIALTVTI